MAVHNKILSPARVPLSSTSVALSSTHVALSRAHAALSSTHAALSSTHAALSSTHAALSSTSVALSSTHAALSPANHPPFGTKLKASLPTCRKTLRQVLSLHFAGRKTACAIGSPFGTTFRPCRGLKARLPPSPNRGSHAGQGKTQPYFMLTVNF
jgi:hypothetical protein